MLEQLHHVAIVVANLEAAVRYYEDNYGMRPVQYQDYPDLGLKFCMLQLGHSEVELIEPSERNADFHAFLQRGGGLHHLAFAVPDIVAAMAEARSKGLNVVNKDPLPGLGGSRIAFVAPDAVSAFRLELVEEPSTQ